MVRVNLVHPRYLTDQHLIAEYDELLMLIAYIRRYPNADSINTFRLGKGHMRFFKDKLLYLKRRHDALREEMITRGYKAEKVIDLSIYPKELINDWIPREEDMLIVKARIAERVGRKPWYYTYYRRSIDYAEYIKMLNDAPAL